MLKYLYNYKIAICAFIVAFLLGAFLFSRTEVIDPTNEIIELNNKEKEKAIKLAEEYKNESVKLGQEYARAEADKAPLKAEIRALRLRLGQAEAVKPSEPTQEPSGAAEAPLLILKSLVEKQDSLIAGLENDIVILKKQNFNLELSNEQLQKALIESQRNENIRRIQSEAQIAAIKSAKWRGRTEGFTVAALADIGLRLAGVF